MSGPRRHPRFFYMEKISDFSLEPAGRVGDRRERGRSRLLFRGRPTGLVWDGVDLEAQFGCDAGYLLFITDDTPYEERLHIKLLDRRLNLLDALDVGHINTSAVLKDVRPVSPDRVEFSFFGEDRWVLTVLRSPVWRFPTSPLATVSRPLDLAFSKSRLRLSGAVGEERYEV